MRTHHTPHDPNAMMRLYLMFYTAVGERQSPVIRVKKRITRDPSRKKTPSSEFFCVTFAEIETQ